MISDRPKATVDHDLCVGVAMCRQLAPGAFVADDAGLSVFNPRGEWTAEELREAADSCPMAAIAIVTGDGAA